MLDRESGKQNTLMNEKQEQQHRAADEKEKWINSWLDSNLNLSYTIETKKLPKENVEAALWWTFHNKFFLRDTITNLSHGK